MKPSDNCLAIVRRFEGFRASPYLCPAGVPTIGYGSTRYEDGSKVSLTDPPITQERADQIMLSTLSTEYAPAVNRYVRASINQNQFDALIDFCYNLGPGDLATMLHHGFNQAPVQIPAWCYAEINGIEQKDPPLVARRAREVELFNTPV